MTHAEHNRRYRAKHKARVAETQRKNYKKNREKHKARCLARQALRSAEMKAQRAAERPLLDAIDPLEAAMTYEEIAAKLGISRARVGQLVASALRKLRKRNPHLAELFAP